MKDEKIIDFLEYQYINTPKYKSDEILEQAFEASSKSKAIKLAKKALEIYPDNIDAESLLADYEENMLKKLNKYNKVIEKATKLLEKQDMFKKENIGDFWLILETRPYMRARYNKILILKDLGRNTEALKECEEVLRLCKHDNMGVRYILLNLYCLLEKFEECQKLYKKYNDSSAHMQFSMAIMYYKKGDYTKCIQFLRKLEAQNEFVLDFLLNENGEFLDAEYSEYYSSGSEEEAVIIIHDFMNLLMSVPCFADFLQTEYRKK